MLFWCFSVGLQKYKPLLSPRNLNAYRVSISADVGASVFLFTPSLIYKKMGGAQAFYPKEDNASGLVGLTSSNPRSNIILGLSRQPCKPAGCSGGLWSYL